MTRPLGVRPEGQGAQGCRIGWLIRAVLVIGGVNEYSRVEELCEEFPGVQA